MHSPSPARGIISNKSEFEKNYDIVTKPFLFNVLKDFSFNHLHSGKIAFLGTSFLTRGHFY